MDNHFLFLARVLTKFPDIKEEYEKTKQLLENKDITVEEAKLVITRLAGMSIDRAKFLILCGEQP